MKCLVECLTYNKWLVDVNYKVMVVAGTKMQTVNKMQNSIFSILGEMRR